MRIEGAEREPRTGSRSRFTVCSVDEVALTAKPLMPSSACQRRTCPCRFLVSRADQRGCEVSLDFR